jgi:2-methylisocitrate lyase-like PEP mutase family enzyme
MATQIERAKTFTALHVKGAPIVLFNIWDAGTARAVARAGAKAIATGSWSVAGAHGYDDGELLPFEVALANLREIVSVVDLPVTIDLESGYGALPESVAETVVEALKAGAIGFNLEDQIIGTDALYPVADQASRVRAARVAADKLAVPAYVNARTDLFLNADPAAHTEALLDMALERADAYADAGGSGFFAPGLIDETLIARLCKACPLPVNILMLPNAPSHRRLSELGVARISHGPEPYELAMQLIEDAARRAHSLSDR